MNQFESCLLAEGVRTIEGASPEQLIETKQGNGKSFQALVFDRASEQEQYLQLTALFSHFKKLTNNLFSLFALLLFILGGLAVQSMLLSDQLTSINFFWAFALFFIPNLFMLFVWVFLFLKPAFLQSSSLRKLSLAGIKLFARYFNKQGCKRENYWSLFYCYFGILFGKNLGRYQLSILTHLLWLSYFIGATLMSIVMLATHQVDFIWQTSILSTNNFQTLTQWLAYFPEKLGFPVPSIEQIQQSHLGAENLIDAENRRLAWSSLLISSLLLYGVVPRLLLLLVMSLQFKRVTKHYSLDFSLSYYVQLRQLLKPNKTTLGITDADEEVIKRSDKSQLDTPFVAVNVFPSDFYPLAIELSNKQLTLAIEHLQQSNKNTYKKLINVCDHLTQQQLLSRLNNSNKPLIAIYVAVSRLPDRGLKRFMGELTAIRGKQFHLLLIVDKKQNKQRDSDWYQLANDVGISLNNILHIEVKGANNA